MVEREKSKTFPIQVIRREGCTRDLGEITKVAARNASTIQFVHAVQREGQEDINRMSSK
jgi:hypothetical protein